MNISPKSVVINTFAAKLAPHFYRNHTNVISSARLTFVWIQIVYTYPSRLKGQHMITGNNTLCKNYFIEEPSCLVLTALEQDQK